jgi:hypothetical protein
MNTLANNRCSSIIARPMRLVGIGYIIQSVRLIENIFIANVLSELTRIARWTNLMYFLLKNRCLMTSSRIVLQELFNTRANDSDPHNNQTNPTIQRLRERLNAGNKTDASPTLLGTGPKNLPSNSTYADTITGPEGSVYQVSGPNKDEVENLIASIMAYNVTLGGNCSQPTPVLYSTAYCPDYNATAQSQLDFQACDGSSELSDMMANILKNTTALCAALVPSSESNARMAVASTALALLMVLVLSLTVVAHNKKSGKKENRREEMDTTGEEEKREPLLPKDTRLRVPGRSHS